MSCLARSSPREPSQVFVAKPRESLRSAQSRRDERLRTTCRVSCLIAQHARCAQLFLIDLRSEDERRGRESTRNARVTHGLGDAPQRRCAVRASHGEVECARSLRLAHDAKNSMFSSVFHELRRNRAVPAQERRARREARRVVACEARGVLRAGCEAMRATR